MLIALDYDDTYTKDPEYWLEFIESGKKRNHEFIVVTMRNELTNENLLDQRLVNNVKRVIYTNRKAKVQFVANLGIKPDIWIDDRPWLLLNDALN